MMKIVKYLSFLLAIFLQIASGLVPHHRKGTSINYVVYLEFECCYLYSQLVIRINKQTQFHEKKS